MVGPAHPSDSKRVRENTLACRIMRYLAKLERGAKLSGAVLKTITKITTVLDPEHHFLII